jgi:CBS domain-containing protein
VLSVYVTKLVYWIEDAFEKIPVHWMWWPAIGAVAVGVCGWVSPHTLGVGYDNIEHIVSGELAGRAMIFLCVMKFISWSISLGSGTSGGTLAPLFTIGGGAGSALGLALSKLAPSAAIDVRVAALVGMAAIFAGASRALLASVVFAFETTRQPMGLLPLLDACTFAYLVSCLLMKNTIMTEKLVRRGQRVPNEYAADFLETVLVRDAMARTPVTLAADDTLEKVRPWLSSQERAATHQGFPVLDGDELVGVVTRRDLTDRNVPPTTTIRGLVKRAPVVVSEASSLREAADQMAHSGVGRLPVMNVDGGTALVGIITRSDVLGAHRERLASRVPQSVRFPLPPPRKGADAHGR